MVYLGPKISFVARFLFSCKLDDGWLVVIRAMPVRSPQRELQTWAAKLVVRHLRAA
jgi:hypothetical protein